MTRENAEAAVPKPPGSNVVISVRDLWKSFGDRAVLKGVTLDIYEGETIVIMGGSGCGKSTLLRHLLGAYRPDRGEIHVLGKKVTPRDPESLSMIRRKTGILFQSGALYNSMTVGDNIGLPIREHTDLADDVVNIMVKMKLELVGLRDAQPLMPSQISGGMRKRVGLARAIALEPRIVYYDEPTTGLDPITAGVIDHLIMDLSGKLHVTSVVVTHDMGSAFKVADRMAMLYMGEVIILGTPDEIRNSSDERVQQFINGKPDGPIPLHMCSTDYLEDLLDDPTARRI